MKLDYFDMTTLAVAALILAAAAVIGINGTGAEAHVRPDANRAAAAPPDPAMYPKLDAAERLLVAGQAEESVDVLKDLEEQYPAQGRVHALMGQAYARLLDYPRAMKSFKAALLIDPDYVDKKSEKFIGKRIKAAMTEGMAEARAGLDKDPEDKAARAALKDAYYLERMLAGGCE